MGQRKVQIEKNKEIEREGKIRKREKEERNRKTEREEIEEERGKKKKGGDGQSGFLSAQFGRRLMTPGKEGKEGELVSQ